MLGWCFCVLTGIHDNELTHQARYSYPERWQWNMHGGYRTHSCLPLLPEPSRVTCCGTSRDNRRLAAPTDPPADPAGRLEEVIRAFTAIVLETEAQQRTMLRLSLEADSTERAAVPLRQGRAIGWIEEALAPLGDQLTKDRLRLLVLAIRSAVGIEALAWLTDIAGLPRDEAANLMAWSAQALLHGALTWEPPGSVTAT